MALSKSYLEEQSNEKLRSICMERGITGMSKQPKSTLVTVILNDLQAKNEIPTRASLEGKSVLELQKLCQDRGMIGLDKQPKPILVELLLNDYAAEVINGVEGTIIIEKDEEGEVTTTVKISCGGSEDRFPVVGRSVKEIMDFYKETLNIPEEPVIMINGEESTNKDYVLESGDELDFVQRPGVKGN